MVPQSDAQFADIVRWVIYAMIQAEEFGITSENIDDYLTSELPEIQRLLGTNDNSAGAYFGIPNDFVVTVIRQSRQLRRGLRPSPGSGNRLRPGSRSERAVDRRWPAVRAALPLVKRSGSIAASHDAAMNQQGHGPNHASPFAMPCVHFTAVEQRRAARLWRKQYYGSAISFFSKSIVPSQPASR
ncbi:MAG: hypothetical protein IPK19_21520 [Chloroflexi bacterium]|nr:hypothetical protein [Chloroflexota bacterium]